MNKKDDAKDDAKEEKKVYTVSDINILVKNILKKEVNGKISVVGEVSNFKISREHLYMNLKDKDSIINVVCWSFAKRFPDLKLDNGNKVTISGYLNASTKYGNYQLTAYNFKLDGTGDLHKEYLIIKEECEKLGYFDEKHKIPMPKNINSIGVITALGGAALKDFLYVLEHGNFKGTIYIKGCNVQGKDCPSTVIKSLEEMDQLGLDVIVITRGGGSYEDLFGFSDFNVVKSIYNTKTCIISAIGHEIDFMLSDFVADIRAPTPSIAGDILASHQNAQYNLEQYKTFSEHLQFSIKNRLHNYIFQLNEIRQKLMPYDQIADNYRKDFDNVIQKIKLDLKQHLFDNKAKLDSLEIRVDAAYPKNMMEKGFVILSEVDNDNMINSVDELLFLQETSKNKKLKIQLIDGEAFINISRIKIKHE